jgi:hypothetical protein
MNRIVKLTVLETEVLLHHGHNIKDRHALLELNDAAHTGALEACGRVLHCVENGGRLGQCLEGLDEPDVSVRDEDF